MTIELTKNEAAQLLQLLDISIGAVAVGQRLATANVALPIAIKIEQAIKSEPEEVKV